MSRLPRTLRAWPGAQVQDSLPEQQHHGFAICSSPGRGPACSGLLRRSGGLCSVHNRDATRPHHRRGIPRLACSPHRVHRTTAFHRRAVAAVVLQLLAPLDSSGFLCSFRNALCRHCRLLRHLRAPGPDHLVSRAGHCAAACRDNLYGLRSGRLRTNGRAGQAKRRAIARRRARRRGLASTLLQPQLRVLGLEHLQFGLRAW